MKRNLAVPVILGVYLCAATIVGGCGSSLTSDVDGAQGTSTIRGRITSFEGTDVAFMAVSDDEEGLIARVVSHVSEVFVPFAYARGRLVGITVFLDGTDGDSVVTGEDGIFVFT